MAEYIERESIKKSINALLDMVLKFTHSPIEIKQLVFDVIDEERAADVQPVKWISVDDRLPNIDERVLVYIPRPDNHYNIEIAYISEGNDNYPYWVLRDKSQFYSTRFHYISYWMPLPEPPKDGDVDE